MRTRAFTMHFCCTNCLKQLARVVHVPQVEDAPYDVDSFVESAAAARVRFSCSRCEGTIGKLIAVTVEDGDESEVLEAAERGVETPDQGYDFNLRAVVGG